MQVGLLVSYDKKRVEDDVKAGRPVVLGVSVESLLDEINLLEASQEYNLPRVLGQLKLDCLECLGRIVVKKEEGREDGKKDL